MKNHFILLFTTLLFFGCSSESIPPLGENLIDALVDTVYSNASREVVLTNLTGGFYYDDAFRDQKLGEYGYSRWEQKLLYGWHILDSDSSRIDDEPDICIVRPHLIERYFLSGLRETVECPPGRDGLLMTIKPGKQKKGAVRPLFDMQRSDEDKSPGYVSYFEKGSRTVSVSRADSAGGWIALAFSKNLKFIERKEQLLIAHSLGKLTGRRAESQVYIAGDMLFSSRAPLQIAFGWGITRKDAVEEAAAILNSVEIWRTARRQWLENVIARVNFRCDNRQFERAFAWARITLAGLMTAGDAEKFLITGIPHDPLPDGWHTSLSAYTVALSEGDPGSSFDLLNAITVRQNLDSRSRQYGMLPTKISEESAEYRIPEIAGLAAMAYKELIDRFNVRDTTFQDSIAAMLARDLIGSTKFRHLQGLIVNESDEHFLYDGPAAPDRSGATFETQALFDAVRNYLERYKRLELVTDILPGLIDPKGGWTVSRKADKNRLPIGFTTGIPGSFKVPMPLHSVHSVFYRRKNSEWSDRLPFSTDVAGELDRAHSVAEQFVSIPLGLSWRPAGGKPVEKYYFNQLLETGYAGVAGLHSLAKSSEDFQPAHEYLADGAPLGTISRGDVLLWTSYALSKIYSRLELADSIETLVDELSDRIFSSGVIGGLPEAENGSEIAGIDNSTGSKLHCTSTASFIRIVYEKIIGLVPGHQGFIRFSPNIPEKWGNYLIRDVYQDGDYLIERRSATQWRVSQQGIEPELNLSLDLRSYLGKTARGSVQLKTGETRILNFIESEDGKWKMGEELVLE